MEGIKAGYLRIGNIGVNPNTGHPDIISAHDMLAIMQREIEGYSPNYEPIPLTEDWLKRLGFTYKKPMAGGQDQWAGYGFWSYKDFHLLGTPKAASLYFDRNHDWEICFVHELQNLYHALTGAELTINKP